MPAKISLTLYLHMGPVHGILLQTLLRNKIILSKESFLYKKHKEYWSPARPALNKVHQHYGQYQYIMWWQKAYWQNYESLSSNENPCLTPNLGVSFLWQAEPCTINNCRVPAASWLFSKKKSGMYTGMHINKISSQGNDEKDLWTNERMIKII